MKKKLTYDRLHELLNYNPETGIFVWKERLNKDGQRNKYSSKAAGTLQPTGYIRIEINRKSYLGHRLAWLYIHGYFPEYQIDHVNGIRDDNRLNNLREVSRSCNLQNCKISVRNKSGITGVSWYKPTNKWMARIMKKNKQIHLGLFANLLEAAKARYAGEQKYFTCVVKSSALKYIEKYNARI